MTDHLNRKVSDQVGPISRSFTYHAGAITAEHQASGKTKGSAATLLVSQITLSNGRTLSYEYDKEERITKVIDSVEGITEYTYDALGQLLTETKNGILVNSMTYDNYGNILTRNGKQYCYDDGNWKDKLTCYDGQSITYDAQGNPTLYLGHTLSWEKGRQLKAFDNSTYTYNANGIRTSKTVDGIKHTYTLDGTKILKETWGSNTLIPLYDNEESVCGIVYNQVPYTFLKNLQGDVIAIADSTGSTVARYEYDAWGVCTVTQNNRADIANVNPFRYRGYYYDVETPLYYLQSRYYDPVVGRFVNEDEVLFLNGYKNNVGLNTVAYCINSPTNYYDPSGKWVLSVGVEGQAAFVLGVYVGFAVNIDGRWNISITYSVGFAIITNISAYIQAYIAYYIGKSNVSQLSGWGVSLGVSFSAGVHVSGGGAFDVGFGGSVGGNINVGYGTGASVAPIPYFQTRVGYSGTLYKFNLLDVLQTWKNNVKKSFWFLALNVIITKKSNYIEIYIKPLKIRICLYKGGKIKVK